MGMNTAHTATQQCGYANAGDCLAGCTQSPCKRELKKQAPIYNTTRWTDAKGRVWRVLENMYFGRYLCVLADKPSYSGVWTSKEIRAALAKAKGQP
jgi:hypothetical protein